MKHIDKYMKWEFADTISFNGSHGISKYKKKLRRIAKRRENLDAKRLNEFYYNEDKNT